MSASREKKARQERGADYVSPKQQKELEEKKANRRTTLIFTAGVVLVAAVFVLTLLNNSGVFKRGAAAATVNGETYTAGDVAYYYYNTRASLVNNGSVDGSASLRTQDFTSNDTYDTWYDYAAEQAVRSLATVHMAAKAANEAGYTFGADAEETVNATLDSLKEGAATSGYTLGDYIKAIFGGLMTRSSFEKELRTAALADSYTTSKAQPSGYTEAELQETYDAAPDRYSMVDYEAVIFPSSNYATDAVEATDTTPAVEASDGTAEALTAAQEALAAYKDGASLEALAEEAGLTYTNTKSLYGTSDMLAWLFDEARTEGDADVVDYTYYGVPMGSVVVVFHGKERADFHSVDVRHILVADEAEANDLLAQYLAGEQTEDAFAALATAHSTDTGSTANGGLSEAVYIGQMVKPFENWCFDASRKAGDTGIVATDYGYHVMYYVGSSEYPFWQHQAASTLASDWEASLAENMETTLLDGMKYVDP